MAGRNRSLSRDRGRKDSYTDEDNYRYSDESFTDDDEDDDYSQQKNSKKPPRGGKNSKKPPPANRNRGRTKAPSQQSTPRRDEISQRMLSAKRLRMNELRNLLEETNLQMKQLKDENKLLRRMQVKQDKALVKYEDRESQLPQFIQRQQNEQRSMREQLRKAREKHEKTDRYLRDAEDELERTKVKLKKYKNLVEDKGLQERDELNRKLSQAEIDLEEKNCKIKELEKHTEKLKKNHRHEIGIEMARTREAQRNLEEMKRTCNDMEIKLKEKEKELQLKNIYSNRAPPHRLPASYSGTPQHSPLPPPRRKRAPSLSEMSSRDKAKMYESKRREEEQKKREKAQQEFNRPQVTNTWEADKVEDGYKPVFASSKKEDSFSSDSRDHVKDDSVDWFSSYNKKEEERLKQFQQEREEEERLARRERVERLEQERKENEEQERRERNERERREKEERERKEREERERRDREWEREEQERRERERKQREVEEQERKARQEREMFENDEKLKEERRKKDELLAKLRALDNNDPFAVPSTPDKKETTPIFDSDDKNKSKKGKSDFWGSFSKDDTSDKEKETTNTRAFITSNMSESGESHRSNYSFTKPIENMHHGRPSHEDVKVPYIEKQKKRRARQDEDSYEPSFAPSKPAGKTTKTQNLYVDEDKRKNKNRETKKKDLMSDLFPDSKPKNEKDDIFLITDNKNKGSNRFNWDDDLRTTNKASPVKRRENSSTLFGGGSALIDDDEPVEDRTKILPRRPRQSNTYQSKPAVSAVDQYDDEIEEVML